TNIPLLRADDFLKLKQQAKLPNSFVVLFGKNSGKEIQLKRAESIELSLDWVMAVVIDRALSAIIPIEVQSMDTTGNYRDNWEAYSRELPKIPESEHGINWANVWKRLIPQLILKGSISATSSLCKFGHYFIVPDIVYARFERLIGEIKNSEAPGPGIMTVMTYALGPETPFGEMRSLKRLRTARVRTTDFAEAFASGKQLPLGTDLDNQVIGLLGTLSDPMFAQQGRKSR
ncbi:MAG: restriction endonuclease, partial [Acidobacteriia bacterium]|nr:restriction endonuclease [Terriglobia bacterium]